ncbi:hypothetical protein CLOM_g3160, partial [Closterium sp. NIES-68]
LTIGDSHRNRHGRVALLRHPPHSARNLALFDDCPGRCCRHSRYLSSRGAGGVSEAVEAEGAVGQVEQHRKKCNVHRSFSPFELGHKVGNRPPSVRQMFFSRFFARK